MSENNTMAYRSCLINAMFIFFSFLTILDVSAEILNCYNDGTTVGAKEKVIKIYHIDEMDVDFLLGVELGGDRITKHRNEARREVEL